MDPARGPGSQGPSFWECKEHEHAQHVAVQLSGYWLSSIDHSPENVGCLPRNWTNSPLGMVRNLGFDLIKVYPHRETSQFDPLEEGM